MAESSKATGLPILSEGCRQVYPQSRGIVRNIRPATGSGMHIAAAAAPRSGRYSLRVRIIALLSPIRVDRNSRLPMRRIVPALIAACLAWAVPGEAAAGDERSEEHTSELQSL